MPRNVVTALLLAAVAAWAMAQQTTPPAPSQPESLQPDDPRLVQIVDLVRAGLSEALVAEHVSKMQPGFNLTTKDLLYLKQNNVPESIISALMTTARAVATPTPTPTPTPEPVREVDGLILDRGLGRKDHLGKLVISRDEINWVDREDSRGSLTLYPQGIRSITLRCRPSGTESFCYQLNIKMIAGDTFEFEDAERERGGNRALLRALEALKEFFPNLTVVEKTK